MPGPMTSLTGDWSLAIEDGHPVLTMDLEWSSASMRVVEVALGIVAVAQTPTAYVAFLDIPLPEKMLAGTRYEVRAEYDWDEFLRLDLSGARENYLSTEAARKAMSEGVRISQIVITRADFVQQ